MEKFFSYIAINQPGKIISGLGRQDGGGVFHMDKKNG
jgi:hypothetical protein